MYGKRIENAENVPKPETTHLLRRFRFWHIFCMFSIRFLYNRTCFLDFRFHMDFVAESTLHRRPSKIFSKQQHSKENKIFAKRRNKYLSNTQIQTLIILFDILLFTPNSNSRNKNKSTK